MTEGLSPQFSVDRDFGNRPLIVSFPHFKIPRPGLDALAFAAHPGDEPCCPAAHRTGPVGIHRNLALRKVELL